LSVDLTVDVGVAVIGAGFAGVTAARELSSKGLDVVVLEGQ
jgi:monoamine oxidase